MKIKNAILGLAVCATVLVSLNSIQKFSQANIGWGISAAFGADDNTTSTNVIAGGALGGASVAAAISGAEIGAEIGIVGGAVGIGVGIVVGGL